MRSTCNVYFIFDSYVALGISILSACILIHFIWHGFCYFLFSFFFFPFSLGSLVHSTQASIYVLVEIIHIYDHTAQEGNTSQELLPAVSWALFVDEGRFSRTLSVVSRVGAEE